VAFLWNAGYEFFVRLQYTLMTPKFSRLLSGGCPNRPGTGGNGTLLGRLGSVPVGAAHGWGSERKDSWEAMVSHGPPCPGDPARRAAGTPRSAENPPWFTDQSKELF
jgi:hypothetical protein